MPGSSEPDTVQAQTPAEAPPETGNPSAPDAEPAAEAPGEAPPADLPGVVEAVLMTLDRPMPAAKLAEALAETPLKPDAKAIDAAVRSLNKDYDRTGRSFRIEQVAGGYRIMTRPRFASALAAFHRSRSTGRLSRAAIETLAIIAYRQPITRAELEAIRGVACGEVLRSLLERRMIQIAGRAEEVGRPMLYGTTRQFLDTFGLASLKDLPASGELRPVEPAAKPVAGPNTKPEPSEPGPAQDHPAAEAAEPSPTPTPAPAPAPQAS